MFYYLTQALQERLLQELRDFWATHPKFPDLVDNIQGKYSFEQRPQYGIIVKTGPANKVQLSADNFVGTVQSFVALAKIPGYPGLSCEWVREDSLAIQANNGVFPSPPGVYYVEMTEDDQFYVDPLLSVQNERLTMVTPSECVLQNVPYAGSLRVIEIPGGNLLVEGTDYTIDPDGVTIHLTTPLPPGLGLRVDYRYAGESTGPWEAKQLTGYNKAIPGVVMAFGRRGKKGDRFAVLVSDVREDAYLEYGGRWDLSIDMDVVSRDVYAQREIADVTTMFFWAILRPIVVDQGLDITEIAMGGESEEIFDDNADDYFYNSTISMTVQTDWFLYLPLTHRVLTVSEIVKGLPPGLTVEMSKDPFYGARYSTTPTVS